jgi:histidinol-phosphate aminotransferase
LAGAAPYGAPQLAVPVRLNVNENPYAPPAAVIAAIASRVKAAAAQANRYPDRDFTELRHALRDYLAEESQATYLSADQIWAANGSNEVMLHVLQAFGGPGRTVTSFSPTYSMYPEYARDTFTTWLPGEREPDFSIDLERAIGHIDQTNPSVVLLASPNNPTGTAVPPATIEALAKHTAGRAILVVDEAYAEFRRPGTPSALALVPNYNHLAVVRTMSKAFAFAGVRLGYLAGSAELVGYLRTVRLPYHLSAITQAAALAALEHRQALMAQVAQLCVTRDYLAAKLRERDLEVPDSDANFVLFGRFADRHAVWQGLLDRGVLIREVGPDGWLRVSAGTEEETDLFLDALADVLDAPGRVG